MRRSEHSEGWPTKNTKHAKERTLLVFFFRVVSRILWAILLNEHIRNRILIASIITSHEEYLSQSSNRCATDFSTYCNRSTLLAGVQSQNCANDLSNFRPCIYYKKTSKNCKSVDRKLSDRIGIGSSDRRHRLSVIPRNQSHATAFKATVSLDRSAARRDDLFCKPIK